MLNRSFFCDRYPQNSHLFHYLANDCLKLKLYGKALSFFYRSLKHHMTSNYLRSIAYIRIGEFYYLGNLPKAPQSSEIVCKKDLKLAEYYFKLGIKVCLKEHNLKQYAKRCLGLIEREQKVIQLTRAACLTEPC